MTELLESEKRKFAKLMQLEGFGHDQIVRLKNSRVGVVGLSGIGVHTLLSIIPIGVTSIKVVDVDTVDETTLPQTTFFGRGDIGKLKTIALKEKLVKSWLVDSIKISNVEIRESNIADVLAGLELIIYASFTPEKLRLVAEFCSRNGLPLIWTASSHTEFYLMYADGEHLMAYVERAIEVVGDTLDSDTYYPSTVSSIAGGAAATLVQSVLLGRARPMLRKCDVNTLQVEFFQPN